MPPLRVRVRVSPRYAGRALCVLLTALVVALVPGTASAHERLERSDPAPGAVLVTPPSAVVLVLSEPLALSDGVIHVFDDRFHRVDTGSLRSAGQQGRALQVGLRQGLAEGTYTVAWRASSADTHPVSGSFRFSIGHASVVRGAPPAGRNDAAGLLLGLLRWTSLAGLVIGPGVLLVVLALWPQGLSDRRTVRLVGTGLVVLGASTAGAMVLQGLYASGEPFGTLWRDPATLDTHSRRFDQVHAARMLLIVGLLAVLALLRQHQPAATGRRRPLVLLAAFAWVVVLVGTWPFVGHSSVGDLVGVAIAANLLHTLAMTLWLGGLVLLVVSLRRPDRVSDLARVLPSFSRLAQAAVATLVVTGGYLAWREVGSLSALRSTLFGALLLVKLGGVAVLLLLGDLARRWVGRNLSPVGAEGVAGGKPEADRARGLHRGLAAELTLAAGVLAVTAALVVVVPARQAYVRPFLDSIRTSGFTVLVEIPAPREGDAALRVSLRDADGTLRRIIRLEGYASLVGSGTEPSALRDVGPTSPRTSAEALLTFASAGTWVLQLQLVALPDERLAVSALVPVR